MEYLEGFLGESADKHEKELIEHKSAQAKELIEHRSAQAEHKTSMETRLEYVESLLGDSADKHSKEIEEARAKLGDLHVAVSMCAKHDHHSALDERLGAVADKHLADVKANKAKIKELQCVADEQFADVEATNAKIKELQGQLTAQDSLLDRLTTALEDRCVFIERKVLDCTDATERKVLDCTDAHARAWDQRLHCMQENQNRAHDVLEDSFQEQLRRLEHAAVRSQATQIKEQWNHELKARQADVEKYKDLLKQESSSREVTESMLRRRLQECECSIPGELKRVCQYLEGRPVSNPTTVIEKMPVSPSAIIHPVSPSAIIHGYSRRYHITSIPSDDDLAHANVEKHDTNNTHGFLQR